MWQTKFVRSANKSDATVKKYKDNEGGGGGWKLNIYSNLTYDVHTTATRPTATVWHKWYTFLSRYQPRAWDARAQGHSNGLVNGQFRCGVSALSLLSDAPQLCSVCYMGNGDGNSRIIIFSLVHRTLAWDTTRGFYWATLNIEEYIQLRNALDTSLIWHNLMSRGVYKYVHCARHMWGIGHVKLGWGAVIFTRSGPQYSIVLFLI